MNEHKCLYVRGFDRQLAFNEATRVLDGTCMSFCLMYVHMHLPNKNCKVNTSTYPLQTV